MKTNLAKTQNTISKKEEKIPNYEEKNRLVVAVWCFDMRNGANKINLAKYCHMYIQIYKFGVKLANFHNLPSCYTVQTLKNMRSSDNMCSAICIINIRIR